MLIKLIQYYSHGRYNQHLEQVLQSSRHSSSYGLLVTIKGRLSGRMTWQFLNALDILPS